MSLTESTMLALGTVAPEFALTNVITGTTVSPDNFRGREALLVMFICAHCPYVKHINQGLGALGKDYATKSLAILAISSNDAATHPADSPEAVSYTHLRGGRRRCFSGVSAVSGVGGVGGASGLARTGWEERQCH